MLGAFMVRMKARSAFGYLNKRDLSAFLRDWRDDALFVYPGGTSASGEHVGKENIGKWWQKFFVQFPESYFTCKNVFIEKIYALGLSNEISLHWDVAVTNREGKKFKNSGVSIIKIEKGKIAYCKDYIFDLETLRKAWGE